MTEDLNPPAGSGSVSPEDVITVAGELGRRSATITSCGMSLVAGVGTDQQGRTFLVPFLDCFGDMECDAGNRELRATLTFDNVAFLIGRVSVEYANILKPLMQMSAGELRPEASRLRFATEALEAASRDLAEAAQSLRTLEQRLPSPVDLP